MIFWGIGRAERLEGRVGRFWRGGEPMCDEVFFRNCFTRIGVDLGLLWGCFWQTMRNNEEQQADP